MRNNTLLDFEKFSPKLLIENLYDLTLEYVMEKKEGTCESFQADLVGYLDETFNLLAQEETFNEKLYLDVLVKTLYCNDIYKLFLSEDGFQDDDNLLQNAIFERFVALQLSTSDESIKHRIVWKILVPSIGRNEAADSLVQEIIYSQLGIPHNISEYNNYLVVLVKNPRIVSKVVFDRLKKLYETYFLQNKRRPYSDRDQMITYLQQILSSHSAITN
jgi:hypothetical protein